MTKAKCSRVQGVGINDSEHPTELRTNGMRQKCPFYLRWYDMLERCYSASYKNKHPTYQNCIVIDEWLLFSNFKRWMEKQDWQGKSLDKDILIVGNKIYSPQSCVFIDQSLNLFTVDRQTQRGKYPLGVGAAPSKPNPYRAQCKNPFTGVYEHLGVFSCPMEAHKAWQAKKHEHACALADLQTDPRVAQALRERYAPDKDWSNR